MAMFRSFDFIALLYRLPAIVIGISFHEFAHALASDRLGDPTPRRQGRVTLFPLAHFDPIGFICILFAPMGWGKPVMVNKSNYRNPRVGGVIVSVAGCVMNVAMAFAFAAILKVVVMAFFPGFTIVSLSGGAYMAPLGAGVDTFVVVFNVFFNIIVVNLSLSLFNLLPIPPLDGFNILSDALPYDLSAKIGPLRQFGFVILLVLVLTQVLQQIISPPINAMLGIIGRVVF